MEERKKGLFRNISWKLKGAIFIFVIALIGFIDIPQTVRIKAMIIKILPLHHESTISLIHNLCDAAHNNSEGAYYCYRAHQSTSAESKAAELEKAEMLQRVEKLRVEKAIREKANRIRRLRFNKELREEREKAEKAKKAREEEWTSRLPPPPPNLPLELQIYINELINKRKEYGQQKITSTMDYNTFWMSITRMRGRHSKYRDYIDNVVKVVIGIDPSRME